MDSAPNNQFTPLQAVVIPPAKPGWKTSEFWAHVALMIGLLVGAIEGLPPQYAAIAAAVSTSAYAISRALTKGPGSTN